LFGFPYIAFHFPILLSALYASSPASTLFCAACGGQQPDKAIKAVSPDAAADCEDSTTDKRAAAE